MIQGMETIVLEMGMKRRVGVVDWLPTVLDLQGRAGIVVVMKAQYAILVVLAAPGFDMMIRDGAAGMPSGNLLAVLAMAVVDYIDTACDPVVWVSFESHL